MEQNIMDYKNGKIYVLRSHQTEDIYIGSTTTKLTKRLSKHKSDFKRWKNGKYNYITSFELMKYDDAYIELLELCPCDFKMELCRREGEFIRSMKCINKEIAGRTMDEWREDNKDKIKIQKREYYETNKEIVKEYTKEYREKNKNKINRQYECECGGKYTQPHKSQHLKTKKHLNHIPLV